jgi:proteasome accessory factor B
MSQSVSQGRSRPPLERMMKIHDQLRENKYPNATGLAKLIEVCTKTIHRDIEFMRDRLNLPVEFSQKHNGYWYTEPVANFPTVQVTEGELVALYVAEKALAQYRGTPFEKPLHAAFQKLTRGLSDTISFTWDNLDQAISFRSIGTTTADLQQFETVSRAVVRSEEIEFEYQKLNNSRHERRQVRPYHLGCVENQWYLFAFDLNRQQMRTFVLSRMRAVKATGHRFRRPPEFSVSELLAGSFGVFSSDRTYLVRIQFDRFAAQLVRERRWHPTQKLRDLPKGRLELAMKLGSLPEVQRWVLSWGEHARVLAPRELQKSVRDSAGQVAKMYP